MRGIEDARAAEFLNTVIDTLKERAQTYPAYSEEARKVAQVWNVLHEDDLDPKDIAELMMIVKLVRLAGGQSGDSLIDLVGYAARLEGMG